MKEIRLLTSQNDFYNLFNEIVAGTFVDEEEKINYTSYSQGFLLNEVNNEMKPFSKDFIIEDNTGIGCIIEIDNTTITHKGLYGEKIHCSCLNLSNLINIKLIKGSIIATYSCSKCGNFTFDYSDADDID